MVRYKLIQRRLSDALVAVHDVPLDGLELLKHVVQPIVRSSLRVH